MDGVLLRLESLFLQNELCESVTFSEHLVLNLFLLCMELLQVLAELLLLEQLIGALVDPVLDGLDIDTLRLVLLLFLLDSLELLFVGLLLQSFELVHFLVNDLVCLLQLVLQIEHSLLFLLDCLLEGGDILAGLDSHLAVAFFAILLLHLEVLLLLLAPGEFSLHDFDAGFLLHHRLLDLVLFLLLGSLLLHDLLVQVVHLLLVLQTESLDPSLVLCSLDRYDLLLMLDGGLRLFMLDLLDPLSPGVL